MANPTSAAQLLELVRGYQPAALLIGLVELDICTALAEAGATPDELAERLGLQKRPLAALLQAATALGLLTVTAGRYHNSELAARCLARNGAEYLGVQISSQADQYRGWLDLPVAVREGRTVLPDLQASSAEDDPALRRLLLGLDSGGRKLLPKLTPLLTPYLAKARRLLDVGCGLGTFGIGWALEYPDLIARLLDKPAVIEIAREVAATSPALSRLDFWPADYRETDFGAATYDLILFFQVLRTESPATIQALLHKAARALAPGGQIAIYDSWLEADQSGPAENVFQNLTLALMYREGALFTEPALKEWLDAAGLRLQASWPVAAARPMRLYLAGAPEPEKESDFCE